MTKMFTHTDLDGIGCAIVARQVYGNNINITYCNYDNIDEKVLSYMNDAANDPDLCLITDISISEKLAKELDDKYNAGNFMQTLDHHPTALSLNKYSWCKTELCNEDGIKTSGTEMLYKYFKERNMIPKDKDTETLKKFVKIVRDYDTYRWAETDNVICKQINDLMNIYGRKKFMTWAESKIHDETFPQLYKTDEILLENKQREIDIYINSHERNMFTTEIGGHKTAVVFSELYMSELGNKLSLRHPEVDFITIVNMNRQNVSFITAKEGIDLGEIAKAFGGGGHPKAAGFQLPEGFCGGVVSLLDEISIFKDNYSFDDSLNNKAQKLADKNEPDNDEINKDEDEAR